MRYYLSPSLMCMDMMKLTEQLRFLNSKADRLHVDIMDGHYVKNLALSASFVAQIRPYTSLPIDVHLMVEAPASFIPALLDAGADVARHQMVGQVVGPYLIIGSVLVVLALVFVFIKFPSCKGAPAQQQQLPTESMGPTLKRLFAIPRFRLGILSQFLYVGAQVGVWSFTIRFVQLVQQGTSEHSATYWLLASLVIYAVGKTVATWLMNRLNPAMLLGTFALAATALLLIAVFSGSMLAVYALILVSFCMAPCWPTNFGLVIKGMGKDTQTAGSIVVMSIIGGAVIPLVMGIISDMNSGNMQIAFIAPLLCFVYVAFYGFWCVRKGV